MGLPSSYKTETRKFRRGLGPAIEWLANAIVSSAANIYYVSTNGNDANSGESWDEAFLTVQAAHDAASEGDLILVAPGEYDEDIEITTGKISIVGAGPRHSIRITGTSAGTKMLYANKAGIITTTVSDYYPHVLTIVSPEKFFDLRRFSITISTNSGATKESSVTYDYTTKTHQLNKAFQVSVCGNAKITITVPNGASDVGTFSAVFLD